MDTGHRIRSGMLWEPIGAHLCQEMGVRRAAAGVVSREVKRKLTMFLSPLQDTHTHTDFRGGHLFRAGSTGNEVTMTEHLPQQCKNLGPFSLADLQAFETFRP